MAKILAKFAPPEDRARFPSANALMATPVSGALATATATITTTISYRKNILDLSATELANLREAFTRLYAMRATDDRSFQYIAGLHGFPPPVYCAHGNPIFVVWHRPYLLMLEKSLQEQVPGVTLPYWDWTSARTQREGIPRAYTDAQDAAGNENSLLKSRIEFANSQFPETFRDPGPLSTLARLAAQARRAQRVISTYTRYSVALESPHNGIHGYVGGTMGQVPYAAYDPIFWAHHANIDRLFAEWQAAHPNIIPRNETFNGRSIWRTPLTPMGVTTADIWNLQDLGYEYLTGEVQATALTTLAKFAGTPVVGFALEAVESPFEKAELEFHNVLHPRSSCEIRVFLNQPEANVNTPTTDNDHYAGSLYLFGHGECPGDAGHCDPDRGPLDQFDIRRPSHVQPFNPYLEVTETIQRLAGTDEITVTLIATNAKGEQLSDPGTDFEAIVLSTS